MLLKHTLLYLPAQFFGPLFQFVSMIVWTHWLVPEQMGVYALATVSQEATYLLSLSWFAQYSLRYFPDRDQPLARKRYLQAETTIVLLAGGLHLIAVWLLLSILDVGTFEPALFAAIAAYFITRTSNMHLSERARADQRIGAYTIVQTAGPVGGLIFGLGLLYLGDGGLVALITGYALAQALGSLVVMIMIGFSLRPRWPDQVLLEPALRYGLPLIGVEVLSWFCDHSIRYLVQYDLGAASLGLLSVGWGLGLRTSAFAAMLVTAAAFPLASKMINAGRRDEAMVQLRTNAALLIGLLFPAMLGLWCIAPVLIELVVAVDYREVTTQILPTALFVGAVRQLRLHISDQIFILDHHFHYSSIVNAIDIAVSVVAISAGLYLDGLAGAATGASVGAVVATIVSLWIAVRRSGFRFPLEDTLRVLGAAALMTIVLKTFALPVSYGGLAMGVAVGMVVYAVAIGALYPRERKWLKERVKFRLGEFTARLKQEV